MDEPRTEQATPRKLARARAHGVVPQSSGLVAAAVMLALLGSLGFISAGLLHAFQQLVLTSLTAAAEPGSPVPEVLAAPAQQVAWLTSLLLLALAFAALLASFLQVGPLLSVSAIALDFGRLDPQQRLRALFSPGRVLDVCWCGLELCVLLGVAAWSLAHSMRSLLQLASSTALHALSLVGVGALDLVLRIAIATAVLGAADLAYRRVRHLQQMRMGRRELRLELRESYGLPEQRERRRRLHEQAAAQTTLAEVEQADVLLLDAAGRAVALAFDARDDAQRAPRLTAKAQGPLCVRLQQRAEQAAVPVRVQPGLVALLFRLELTEEVPRTCYEAVAEVLRELGTETP
jgi:flagellar biosynthesis protein FlhB